MEIGKPTILIGFNYYLVDTYGKADQLTCMTKRAYRCLRVVEDKQIRVIYLNLLQRFRAALNPVIV